MDATQIRELFLLFSEMTTRPHHKYEDDIYDQMRRENKNMMDFIYYVKTHYPEALAEWNALNKIAES